MRRGPCAGMKPDFLSLIRALKDHKIDFIVVGGVAAFLEGAPITGDAARETGRW